MKKTYDAIEKIVLAFSVILSVVSFIYFYKHGLINAYGDAKGHLNIARRVVDNLTPGLAQLGGVWLPLLHVLMLPTIWIDFMWHSGVSGSIVNMPMYIIAVYYFFKLVFFVTKSKFSSLIGVIIVGLNINLLYMQTTPMTEMLFIVLIILATYYLRKWSQTQSLSSLVFTSLLLFLVSTLRYEGWAVVLAGVAFIVLISCFRGDGFKTIEGKTILFSTLAFYGIFLWFVWQLVIFHDPLYFLNSDYSAKGQTLIAVRKGLVPTYNNVKISFLTSIFALNHVIGNIVLVLAIIGLVAFIIRCVFYFNKDRSSIINLPLILLWVPFLFLILALYKGNIPMNVPEFAKNGAPNYFNIRYALYTLPAIAFFASIISKKLIVQIALLSLVTINQILLLPQRTQQIATIEDAKNAELTEIQPAFTWLRRNYDNSLILASAATADPIIFNIGLNMRNFITEGSGVFWTDSMKNPQRYAGWVLITDSDRDMVQKYIDDVSFKKYFFLVKRFGVFDIYRKK